MRDPDALLDPRQAARFLRLKSARRLGDRAWRCRVGLPTIRVGGSLRFDRNALREWLRTRTERSVSGDAA